MPSFRDLRLKLSRDPSFISPLLRFLKSQTGYKSFSLERMAISTDGAILVPLFTTEHPRDGMPDGIILISKSGTSWSAAGIFHNPEPQVL